MIQGNFYTHCLWLIIDLTVKGAEILTVKCVADFTLQRFMQILFGLNFHTSRRKIFIEIIFNI